MASLPSLPQLYAASFHKVPAEQAQPSYPSSPSPDLEVNGLIPKPTFVVMKFGGTSIAKHLSTIVDTIVPAQHIRNTRIPVLVCSAQSYTLKTEGTTQCLLNAIEAAMHPPSTNDSNKAILNVMDHIITGNEPYTPPPTPRSNSPTQSPPTLPSFLMGNRNYPSPRTIIDGVFERHCVGARRILSVGCFNDSETILTGLEKDLQDDCNRVMRLLTAVQTLGEISSQTRDKIVSVGELMACRTVVAALQSRNIPACLVDLTDLNVPGTLMSDISFDPFIMAINHKLMISNFSALGETNPILVATGFFGQVPGSLLDLIGRGYTDVCAALCARAVGTDELQIWKEVDGVFSADPRTITNAHLLPEITSTQAKLLTAYGSEVIHHRAIDQAMYAKIPIIVRNVANPTGPGTRVETTTRRGPARSAKSYLGADPLSVVAPDMFAVTILNDLELVDIRFENWELSPSRHPLSLVLDVVKNDKHRNIMMDLVTSSQDEVSFVVSNSTRKEGQELEMLEELKRVAWVTVSPQMSYLQVIFDQKEPPSTSIEIMKVLVGAQIDIGKISHRRQGEGVGFVIPTSAVLKAGKLVHDTLLNFQH